VKRFEGKVALVTGGNSGIGLATAKRLREEGATLLITGRDARSLDGAVGAIGPGTIGVRADVARLADIDLMFAEAKLRLGKVDVLVANAGIARFGLFAASSEEIFDELFAVNVKGVYFTIQKALPYLNDGASIVLMTSIASTRGTPNMGVYAATKAAVRSFARTAARELLSRNIRVNAVAPGPISTPIIDRSGIGSDQAASYRATVATRVPMGRMGQPEEVASAVVFLASADSAYITGVELNVDGGMGNL
jgi:NAD(P)-dependent dehydrogenase (short-subunit alcohol dehydrogenase family)